MRALAFAPRSRELAVGTADGGIALVAVDRRDRASRRLPGHYASVNSLAFSPDGELLVSASADSTVCLWPLAEPVVEPIVLRGHRSWVWAVAVSRDGRWVASGSADRTVRLWLASNADLAAQVCGHVTRNMSRAEWRDLVSPDEAYEETCPGLPVPEAGPSGEAPWRGDGGTEHE